MQEFLRYNILNFFSLFLVSLLFLHANYFFKRGDAKPWKNVLSFVLLTNGLDILAWLVATGSGTLAIVFSYIINIALFSVATIMTAKIAIFLYYSVEGSTHKLKNINNFFWLLVLVNTLLLILSVPFKFIFYVDANNTYTRGSLYFITIIIILLPLVIILGKLIYKYIKNYSKIFSDNKLLAWLLLFNVIGAALIIYLQGRIIYTFTIVFPFISLSILILHLTFIGKAMTVDYLTKLQNKLGLELYLNQIPKVSEEYIVALFIDLDNFKEINDRFGHKEGDKILIKFAEILMREVKNKNLVARIGGDEFLVIFRTQDLREVDFVSSTIAKEINRYNSNNRLCNIEYSYGISVNDPYEPLDKEQLIEKADKKMYENKFSKK